MRFEEIERGMDVTHEEPLGLRAEKSVLKFLERNHNVFEDVTGTPKYGENDMRHIDIQARLKGLPCAIDVSGATGKRREDKARMEGAMPFSSLHDERGRAVSGPMPHFTLQVDLGYWGRDPDIEGMSQTDIDNKEKEFLRQMLLQVAKLERELSYKRRETQPYRCALVDKTVALSNRSKGLFKEEEIETLVRLFGQGCNN